MDDARARAYQTLSVPNPNPPLRASQVGYIELVSSPDPRVEPMIFALEHTRVRLGRFSTAGTYATSSDVFVAVSDDATAISPMNTMFEYIYDAFHAFDTRSKHGTYVNGELIPRRRLLAPGDVIDIGGIHDEHGALRGHARVVFLGSEPPAGRPIRRAPPRTQYRWDAPVSRLALDINAPQGTAVAQLEFLDDWLTHASQAVQAVVDSPAIPVGIIDGDRVTYRTGEPLTYLPPHWHIELPRACAIVADLCDGLAAQSLALGPFERELVWLRPSGRAVFLGAGFSHVAYLLGMNTRSSIGLGYDFRITPEEMRRIPAGPATNVYDAARLLAELVTGHDPYPAKRDIAYYQAVRDGRMELPPGFPPIERAFAPDPSERMSEAELAAVLRRYSA